MAEDFAPLGDDVAQHFALWAEALAPLIRLHDAEPDAALIDALRQGGYAEVAEALLEGRADAALAAGFAQVLDQMPQPLPAAALDELAADYADAYLNHGFRAAPSGSVWLTEDHLERQEPMFEVRAFYAHYGLSVPDWRKRADDHLVPELRFVAHLLGLGTPQALADAEVFLDRHLLPWLPDFCLRIASRSRQPFLAGVALLTRGLLLALRDDLARASGRPVQILAHAWTTEALRADRQARAEEERPFVPGLSESW
ncbi:molecular chaperone TorD family protein [Rhodobacter sp. Har01]|uniref:TorD/DmsD family molecular chaperone n=1 Tax=Rhodobacter sp. Har01 TaxID=2883999 RepID=UPI001D080BB6|nr:molecular chaperone TorD family protein [Rhodobacter sp. Har01]MCB6179102.1 molecular chaperone TorD family protein [Rhodobacter sp. Har01]